MSFYYRKLAGNISDLSTLKKLLAEQLDFGKVKLVMDRGFYNIANINALIRTT